MVGEGLTTDWLLDGRVTLTQPEQGLRAAIDPVFLAAAVPAVAGETVLDAGSGSGAAALCLAARVEGSSVRGIEIQEDLVRLASVNAEASGLAGRVEFLTGDILAPPPGLAEGAFAHVMANPPFGEAGTGNSPSHGGKAMAVVEGEATLDDWVRFCVRMVRPKGTVTLVHRADRLQNLLAAVGGRLGGIVVFPLWPGPALAAGAGIKPAKRILVQGRKGVATPLRLAPGLVLHRANGAYTRPAEAVLRGAQALELQGAP